MTIPCNLCKSELLTTSSLAPTPSVIPPVLDDDDDDVAWALQTAQVQWKRQAYGDALSWLERAVQTAEGIGAMERAQQLRVSTSLLTQHMWNHTAEALAPLPVPSLPPSEIESLDDDVELDDAEDADLDAAEDAELNEGPPDFSALGLSGRLGESGDGVILPTPSELSQPVNAGFAVPDLSAFKPAPDPLVREEELPTEPELTSPEASAPQASTSEATPALEDDVSLEGIALVEVRGLQDLPDEAQRRLANSARVIELGIDEEIGDFGAALVLVGTVYIMPTLADAACASASAADVVFASGSLTPGVPIRVVGAEAGTRVAVFSRVDLRREMEQCPWVEEDLRQVADHYQALAGAGMGAMGERLDDALRGMITSSCEVHHFGPGEVVVELGQPVEALHIVGAGALEFVDADGLVESAAQPGDFVFAAQILRSGPAPKTARAGAEGALLLSCERKTAHELMLTVPPLLEILAGI